MIFIGFIKTRLLGPVDPDQSRLGSTSRIGKLVKASFEPVLVVSMSQTSVFINC